MQCLFWITVFVAIAFAQNPASPVNYLGSGLDAYKATYGQAPIFQFTYDQGQKIQSPYSKIVYDVPDQMFVKPMQKMEEVIMQGTYSSYDEYLDMYTEWFNVDASIQVGYFGAGFNFNKQLGYVHERMQQHFSAVMHGHHYWTYYIASLYPTTSLNTTIMFKNALDKFPSQIKSQEDRDYAYQFVQTFGTHYMYKAVFGAKVDFDTAISQDLKNSYSMDWISEQYGFSFRYTLFNISMGSGMNQSEIHVSKEFLQESNAETFFVGGDPTLANLDNLDEWVKTLDQNTFPMNTTLVGIWNLATDKTKQATIKQYVRDYMSGKYNEKRSVVQPNLDTSCLGAGINIFQLDGCLANVYKPSTNGLFIVPIPESQFDQFSVVMQEQFDIDAWSDNKYSSSSGFLGLGSDTKEIYKFYQQHYQGKQSMSKIILSLVYYRITAPAFPMPDLNEQFEKELSILPAFNRNDSFVVQQYNQFFNTWGMAVVDEITLGGYFEANVWYNDYFNSVYSGEMITEFSHWTIGHMIDNDHFKFTNTSRYNQEFDQSTMIEYVYVGGYDKYNISQFDQWAGSVKDNLQIVKYHLQPLSYFIIDQTIRDNVERAIEYFTKQSMSQLQEYINSLSL